MTLAVLDWWAQNAKGLEVILDEQFFYLQRRRIYRASLHDVLNWPQYLAEGQKSRPGPCIVSCRARTAWLTLLSFPTGTGNYVVSVSCPSFWSFFSLNWTMTNCYGPVI